MATNLISDTYLTYHTCDVTLYNLSYFFNEELSTHTDAQKLQAELQKVGILVSKVPNIFVRKKNEGIQNLVRWGGANLPTENQKGYIFGTECRIDLKPGCKFKFFCCLEVYVKTSTTKVV